MHLPVPYYILLLTCKKGIGMLDIYFHAAQWHTCTETHQKRFSWYLLIYLLILPKISLPAPKGGGAVGGWMGYWEKLKNIAKRSFWGETFNNWLIQKGWFEFCSSLDLCQNLSKLLGLYKLWKIFSISNSIVTWFSDLAGVIDIAEVDLPQKEWLVYIYG